MSLQNKVVPSYIGAAQQRVGRPAGRFVKLSGEFFKIVNCSSITEAQLVRMIHCQRSFPTLFACLSLAVN